MKKLIPILIILILLPLATDSSIITEYFHEKYIDLELPLIFTSFNEYTEDYRCLDFSKDLQAELEGQGIMSSIISGYNGEGKHAWVAVWFEPQTGEIIRVDDDYTAIKLKYPPTEQEMDDLMMGSKVGSEVFGTLTATVK